MARGKAKTPTTVEERLEQINNQISSTEDALKTLKQQKKELEKEIEDNEKDLLYRSLKEHEITVGEFQNILEMYKNGEVKK